MDDDKEPEIRITAPADADKLGGPRYVFKDEPLKLSAPPETPRKVLVRDALAIARRTAAKHLVVSPSSGDGLRVIK
jgi:hypothetical protein